METSRQGCYDREYFGYLFTKYPSIEMMTKREKKFFKGKFSDLEYALSIDSFGDDRIAKQFRIPEEDVKLLRKDKKYLKNFIKELNIQGENNSSEIKEINNVLNSNIDYIIEKRQDGYSILDITYSLFIPYDIKAWSRITTQINSMEDGVNLQDEKDLNYVLTQLTKGEKLKSILYNTKLFRDEADILDCLERNNIDTKEFLHQEDYEQYVLPLIKYAEMKKEKDKMKIN